MLGEVAQLVEHRVRNAGVEGSNPFFSTSLHLGFAEISPRQASCAAKGLTSEPSGEYCNDITPPVFISASPRFRLGKPVAQQKD